MEKDLQKRLEQNFDEQNIENIQNLIKQPFPEKVGAIFINESGNGTNIKITEKSRKICADFLLN